MILAVKDMTEPDRLGLFRNENYLVHKWHDGLDTVYFSSTRQGNALAIHIAADRKSRRSLRKAVEDYVQASFREYPWCESVIGAIVKPSVVNLAYKCGFEYIADALIGPNDEKGKIMLRVRQ